MEYHHFNHFQTISNVDGNNIFKSMREAEYKQLMEMIKQVILATDLAMYFRYVFMKEH